MPRIPIYNAASEIIAAFEAGRASKRQREQDQLKKETDAQKMAEDKRQFDEKMKQDNTQFKLNLDLQKTLRAIQEAQVKNTALQHFSMYGGPKVKANYAEENAPMINEPITQLHPDLPNLIIRGNEYPEVPYSAQMTMERLKTQGDIAEENRKSREATAAQANELRQQGIDIQKLLADANVGFKQGMLGIAQQNADSNRMRATNQGGPVNEEAKDYNLAMLKSGGLTYDSFSGKDKDKYYNLAVSNNIYPQTKKFVDDSKKLSSTAQFYKLIDRLATNTIKDPNEFAQLLADSASLTQQIGTLGAQYPALGRLSDPDIRLLQTGQPSAKLAVLSKMFGRIPDNYRKALLKNMKNSYAAQVLSHFSTVPNPQEKQRLLEHYNLYVPGMEQTDVFRGRVLGGK